MGTNYYAIENECKECGRYDEIHLGKSSMGWIFSFQYNGGKFYRNIKEMKTWLVGRKIVDEYGDTISHDKFWQMIAKKQKEKNNHGEQYKNNYNFVMDGYSFTDCEFS